MAATLTPATDSLKSVLRSGISSIGGDSRIESLFTEFVASKEYECHLLSILRMIYEEPSARVDVLSSNSFVIFRNDNFLLSMQMVGTEPITALGTRTKYIATAPESGLQAVISPTGSLRAWRYGLPSDVDLSIFDPSARPALIDVSDLTIESPVYRYNAGEVFKLESKSPICVLRLSELATLNYQWTFDPDTLRPVFPSVTLPSVGRMETLMDVAVSLSDVLMPKEDAVDILRSLVDHPLHFIRWKAAQGLGALDPLSALDALRTLTADRHPHIKKAAFAALENIELA